MGAKKVIDLLRNQNPLQVEVEISEININPVEFRVYKDTGYIKIEAFTINSGQNLQTALDYMDQHQIKKIILDLRNNPGGEVAEAVAVAEHFVPAGLITRLDIKTAKNGYQEYYSHLKETKYNLVILVNELTASAGEILAGAVQDSGSGSLVGTQTYGKSKVQSLIPILTPQAFAKYSGEHNLDTVNAYDLIGKYDKNPTVNEIIGWVKMTTGEYITPKGRHIDGQGLSPDFVVNDYQLVNGIDIYDIQKLSISTKLSLNSKHLDVFNMEKILKIMGYDVNEPDLEFDAKTCAALGEYQKNVGLYPSGILDFTTQQSLNHKLDQLILHIDRQYAKAYQILSGETH